MVKIHVNNVFSCDTNKNSKKSQKSCAVDHGQPLNNRDVFFNIHIPGMILDFAYQRWLKFKVPTSVQLPVRVIHFHTLTLFLFIGFRFHISPLPIRFYTSSHTNTSEPRFSTNLPSATSTSHLSSHST